MTKVTEEIWAQRVAAWKASGQSSEVFSRGREFTAGGLRHWAYRLRRRGRPLSGVGEAKIRAGAGAPAKATALRLARVTVVRSPAAAAASDSVASASSASGVALEMGQVRITLAPQFDRETLAAALAVLGTGGAR